jgi:hypothetical protein
MSRASQVKSSESFLFTASSIGNCLQIRLQLLVLVGEVVRRHAWSLKLDVIGKQGDGAQPSLNRESRERRQTEVLLLLEAAWSFFFLIF